MRKKGGSSKWPVLCGKTILCAGNRLITRLGHGISKIRFRSTFLPTVWPGSQHVTTTYARIEVPIFCLTETRNKTPDEGYAQYAAEMYAVRMFNQHIGEPIGTIFGAVTNGFEWFF